MKTFIFGEFKNCYFSVGHYNKENAMGITIVDADTEEDIETLTILDKDYDYEIGVVTIYNDNVIGNEVEGYKTGTQILQELGIVEKIWTTYDLDVDGINSIPISICSINLNLLKDYSRDWNYWGR